MGKVQLYIVILKYCLMLRKQSIHRIIIMNKFAFLSVLLLVLFCGVVLSADAAIAKDKGGFTENTGTMGGFTGPGPALTSVKDAEGMRDDARVYLKGNIIQFLGKDKYLFKDQSGTITVDIDDDEWNGQSVGPQDTVEIYGKVDKDWNSVEIDVKRIIKK